MELAARLMNNSNGALHARKSASERLEEIEACARATEAHCRSWQQLRNFTGLGVGGPVAALVYPSTLAGAAQFVHQLDQADIAWRALGYGTSILAADEPHDFVAVSLRLLDERLAFAGERVRVHAGYGMHALVQAAAERGLSGLEDFAGSQGSVGGVLREQAGWPMRRLWNVVEEVLIAEQGFLKAIALHDEVLELEPVTLGEHDLILGALLKLTPGEAATIRAETQERLYERLLARPVEEESVKGAGRVFKEATLNESAAQVLTQLGLNGKRHGGACVSVTHADYIINDGEATAADVFQLGEMAFERARLERGLDLDYAVEVWRDEKSFVIKRNGKPKSKAVAEVNEVEEEETRRGCFE